MAFNQKKQKIINILKLLFKKEDRVKFYFVKKSKLPKEHHQRIIFKTRKNIFPETMKTAETQFKAELKEEGWEFLRWNDAIKNGLSQSKIYKTPFFDSRNIEIKNPWRSCPIGEYWVKRHPKHLKTGKITDHDGHCRRNSSGKDLLMGEEIDLIISNELFKKPKVKVTTNNLGYRINGNKYDDLISGWTAYWNDVFKLDNPLHPNYVKVLMATESSFLSKSKASNQSKDIGAARGLIQLTEQTYKILKNHKGELKDHLVELDENELWEPNKNIAASIRWLFRKRETAKSTLKREPSWEEVLWDYKGVLKSNTAYAKDQKRKIKEKLDLIKDW